MPEFSNLGDFTQTEQDMDRVAFIDLRDFDHPREWTYGEFEAAITGIARGLASRGLNRGDRVAIVSENRAEFIQTYLAIMRAGLVAVPVNYKLPQKSIRFIFEDSAISLAFVDAERASLCPADCSLVSFDAESGEGSLSEFMDPGPFETIAPEPGDLAEVLYTSGSTGRPKGVMLDHAGQLWSLGFYRMDPARGLIVAPAYHMNGLIMSKMQLQNQGTIVSLPRFDPVTYVRAAAEYKCDFVGGIPTMFAMIARLEDELTELDLSSIQMVLMGSAPVTHALFERVHEIFPNAMVRNGYGTTEAGAAVFGPHPDGLPTPPLSFGCSLFEGELKLVGGPSPGEGVLHIKVPALMTGYQNLPDVTKEKVVDGWYDTGDVMLQDENGFYFFVGRADDMFVCSGENIYPGEVEKMLEQHADIAQAAVVPVADEIKGQLPVAFVVRRPGSNIDEEEVKRFAIENGPAYSHPRSVYFKQSIPLAGTNKVDVKSLKDEAAALRG